MGEKTFLLGKDAALEDTISRTSRIIGSLGFSVEMESWLNPAPNCWSAHIISREYPWLEANGKGSSRLACQASAQAEFLERLATNFFFTDFYLGRETRSAEFVFFPDEKWFPVDRMEEVPRRHQDGTELLNDKLWRFYDPDQELTSDLLHDINSENSSRGICALPFQELESGQTVYFPVNIMHNLYGSNGMSAGNSREECRAQALSEILERYVKRIVISNGLCLPDIPREDIKKFPGVFSSLRKLENHNYRILIKDASLGGRFPVICALLINPDNGGCFAAFGSSCRFNIALERTMAELLQGRGLDQFGGLQPPSHEHEPVADALNLESHFINSEGLLAWSMFRNKPEYSYSPWDFSGNTLQEYEHLKKIIMDNGFNIFCADYDCRGFDSCRIIVPGMSEIYPVSDLLWDNRIAGASLRNHLLALDQMSERELIEFYEILEDLQFSEDQLISEAIGVIFEPDSTWFTLRIGELKALLNLASGHPEEAYSWCNWCVNFGHLPPQRSRLFEVIHALVSFSIKGEDPAEYHDSLAEFYGRETLLRAEKALVRKERFPGLTFAGSWDEISAPQARMQESYQRLYRIRNGKQAKPPRG